MILLMGDLAPVSTYPDVSAMFWPVLTLGILIGAVGMLVFCFILISIFRGSP